MALSERRRRQLHAQLDDSIGAEAADSLMELVPLYPQTDLVTRSDLLSLRSDLESDAVSLRSELRGEMAELRSELRGEMAELRSDLTGEMAELRSELRGEMAELRGEMTALRGELKGEFYRWGAVVVGANTIAMVTALLT